MDERLGELTTEAQHPDSMRLDEMSAREIVHLMNDEDASLSTVVRAEADAIATAVDLIADRFRKGGRLIYMGAGTSGRLGVLDASECPPTFRSDPSQVVGLIAGGYGALVEAVEGAEDNPQLGADDLAALSLTKLDVVVGIATSGRTPYVLGGLKYARQIEAYTIGLSCNRKSPIASSCDLPITPVVGPEILTGSTRMKAGTATKMVLNMLTTGAMVLIGKTYGNLMVDLRASNEKLMDRSRRMVVRLTRVDQQTATQILDQCDGEVKTAILSQRCRLTAQQARALLKDSDGSLKNALQLGGWTEGND